MWSVLSRPSVVIVDQGLIARLTADKEFSVLATPEAGGEPAALENFAGPHIDRHLLLMLGPSFTRWQSVERVRNIWRRSEREATTKALLEKTGALPPADHSIAVADPAPASRWICFSTPTSLLEKCGQRMASGRADVVAVESLAAAAGSKVRRRDGTKHLLVFEGTRDAAWVVKSNDEVLDCGMWAGPLVKRDFTEAKERIQLMHGVDANATLALRLRLDGAPPVESNQDWLVGGSGAVGCFSSRGPS